MARPAGKVINTAQINDQLHIDIIEASALYAVLYKQQSFNIKSRYWNVHGEFRKYNRTTFPSIRAAENLAKKLNKYFNCADFTVSKIM